MNTVMNLAAVACGGALGSCARFMVSNWELGRFSNSTLPWPTLLVNTVGCLLIGLASCLLKQSDFHSSLRIFFIPGILGGFTTYSAFAFESHHLLTGEKQSLGVIYITATVLFGLVGVAIGTSLGQLFTDRG